MNKFKKIWNFLWHEDSVTSWVVSIILAFVIVKFIIYPLIGVFLGTSFPIVAVVSESMEHRASPLCIDYENSKCVNESDTAFKICGQTVDHGGFFTENMYWHLRNDHFLRDGAQEQRVSDCERHLDLFEKSLASCNRRRAAAPGADWISIKSIKISIN